MSAPPLTEPIAILDTFVTGAADLEDVAPGLCRLTLYSEQRAVYGGERERVIVDRLILTSEAVASIMEVLLTAGGRQPDLPASATVN